MESTESTSGGSVTAGVLRLLYGGVTRDELEALVVHLQAVLDEHTVDLADGASASADFEDFAVEIDLSIEGDSVAEFSEVVAALLMRLEEYGVLGAAPAEEFAGAMLREVASKMSLVPA